MISSWKMLSKNSEVCAIGQEHAVAMGCPELLALWILKRRYMESLPMLLL